MKYWISRAIAAAFILLLALPRLSAQNELSIHMRAIRFINSVPDFDRSRYESYRTVGGNIGIRYSRLLQNRQMLQFELGYSGMVELLRPKGVNLPQFIVASDIFRYSGIHMGVGVQHDLNSFGLYVSGQLMVFAKVHSRFVPYDRNSPNVDTKDRYSPFVMQANFNLGYELHLKPIFIYLEVGASLRGQSFLQSQNSGFRIMRNAVLGAGFEF